MRDGVRLPDKRRSVDTVMAAAMSRVGSMLRAYYRQYRFLDDEMPRRRASTTAAQCARRFPRRMRCNFPRFRDKPERSFDDIGCFCRRYCRRFMLHASSLRVYYFLISLPRSVLIAQSLQKCSDARGLSATRCRSRRHRRATVAAPAVGESFATANTVIAPYRLHFSTKG